MSSPRPPLVEPTRSGPSCAMSLPGCILWAGLLLLFLWGAGAIWLWVTT